MNVFMSRAPFNPVTCGLKSPSLNRWMPCGGMKPRLAYTTPNKLQDDGSKIGVELKFNSMEDFEPDNVVQQVDPLRKLVEARQKLSDLLSKMDGNDKLETLLNEVVANADKQKELSDSLGLEGKEN